MTFHFTQQISVRKTGFNNSCLVELGVPTPIADDFVPGSTLVEFDQHPYMATSGWGNLDGSDYPDEVVEQCVGALVSHYDGLTKTIMMMDYSDKPMFWGIGGQSRAAGAWCDDGVSASDDLTKVKVDVDYNSTLYVAYDVSRVAFQSVTVEKDGVLHRFKNVACLPQSSWRQAVATFRMWGETKSWGSEGQDYLTIPFREIRVV